MAVVHESDVRSFLQATLFVQRARAAKQRIDAACSRLGEDAAQLRREVDTASALERQTELEGLLEAAEAKGRRIEEEREALAAQLPTLLSLTTDSANVVTLPSFPCPHVALLCTKVHAKPSLSVELGKSVFCVEYI